MADNEKNIIVPWDFTPIAGYALEHALKIAKISKKLLNVNYTICMPEHGSCSKCCDAFPEGGRAPDGGGILNLIKSCNSITVQKG